MALIKELDDKGPDGTRLGQSATLSYCSFYGATPIVQPLATAQSAVATTALTNMVTTTATSSDFSGQINSLNTRVTALWVLANQIRSDLVTVGLLKGSV